jgi:hypothetical protein
MNADYTHLRACTRDDDTVTIDTIGRRTSDADHPGLTRLAGALATGSPILTDARTAVTPRSVIAKSVVALTTALAALARAGVTFRSAETSPPRTGELAAVGRSRGKCVRSQPEPASAGKRPRWRAARAYGRPISSKAVQVSVSLKFAVAAPLIFCDSHRTTAIRGTQPWRTGWRWACAERTTRGTSWKAISVYCRFPICFR